MSTLHRFARHLAERATAAADPLVVTDIATVLMPYRSCRRALELDSAEDYDLLLLRLVAEDAGLATTFPPEVADRCRAEVGGANPDLSLLERLEGATVTLDRVAIARAPVEQHSRPQPAANAGYELEYPETEAELPPPAAAAAAAVAVPVVPPDALRVEPRAAPPRQPTPPAAVPPLPPPTQPDPVSEEEVADHLEIEPPEPETIAPPTEPVVDSASGPATAEAEPDPLAGLLAEVEAPAGAVTEPGPYVHTDSHPVGELDLGAMDLPGGAVEEPVAAPEVGPRGAVGTAAPWPEPPAPEPAPAVSGISPAIEDPMPAPAPTSLVPSRCPSCAAILPLGRPVRFCPDCGRSVVATRCNRCSADLEPGWRHCVVCGEQAGGDSRFA